MQWRRRIIAYVITFVVIYLGVWMLLVFNHKALLFPRPPATYDTTLANLQQIQDKQGRRVHLQFRLLPDTKGVVLYTHGNATDIGRLGERRRFYESLGWSFCALEYPGYGVNQGALSVSACYDAMDAALAWLKREAPGLPLVLHGRSLGSGLACYAAAQGHGDGLILESAYRSAQRVLLPLRIFPVDYFNNQGLLPQIQQPLCVIHGVNDQVIAVSHGRYVAAHAPNLFQAHFIEGIGHNDLSLHDERVHNALSDYLNNLHLALNSK